MSDRNIFAVIVGTSTSGFSANKIVKGDSRSFAPLPFIENGKFIEYVPVVNPIEFNKQFEADENGTVVVGFGTFNSGLKLYGPFDFPETGIDFAEVARGDYEEYVIFTTRNLNEYPLPKLGE